MWYFDVAYNLKYSLEYSTNIFLQNAVKWNQKKMETLKIQVSIRKWPTRVNVLNYLSTLKNHHDKHFGHLGEERKLKPKISKYHHQYIDINAYFQTTQQKLLT